jgi:serine protease Do
MNHFGSVSISVERELAEVAERLRRSTVEVSGAGHGRGSGVIWRSDGLIVTNAHVATSSQHTIRLADGRVFKAELLRREPTVDLAILKIAATDLHSLEVRDASSLRAGELVVAVGNPMDATGAFSVGVVLSSPEAADVLVRADIRLAPGNSGGPLADAYGRVVGINSMVVAGFGAAVTSNTVERVIAAPKRRSIGITVRQVGVRVQQMTVPGLLVVEVEERGLAHSSGVLTGDVIVRVNGKRASLPGQLAAAIQGSSDVLSLEVLRAGRLQSCELRLSSAETVAEVT